ncbi:hypothetical protein [Streptomyces sp. CO7]
MAAKKNRKILTIQLEIEVNERVTRSSRLEETYAEVIRSAAAAAQECMPEDSIEQITTKAKWEYRHWDPDPITFPGGIVDDGDLDDEIEIEWEEDE